MFREGKEDGQMGEGSVTELASKEYGNMEEEENGLMEAEEGGRALGANLKAYIRRKI